MAQRPKRPRPSGMRRDIAQITGIIDRGELGRASATPTRGEEAEALSVNQIFNIRSYFTSPGGTELFYVAQKWAVLRITLRTAGPVAMGNKTDILPVLSGRGILLVTDQPEEVSMNRGDLLYFASETVNRLSITIQEPPWQQGIALSISRNTKVLADGLRSVADRIKGAF